ncbi:hypothetical protein NQ315_005185 [Exocentrus adspersus]|uniref:Equilibrative nucleoside transporter 3 n=1 Tax=Exocentrus adspersus TaxID=1586481 RepID=A0AAV8VV27_9CUCU|nr:hypothetical protein NQ315_005185 [Exocentrus adspersus]
MRKKLRDEDEEEEHANILYIILFYLLGTVCYIPHNFYVTANEYWMYKFRNPQIPFDDGNTKQKTDLQKQFTAYAGLAVHKMIIGGMVSMLLLFLSTLLFIFIDTDTWQSGFFIIALAVNFLLSACFGILMTSLFRLSNKFHRRCLAAQFAGQATCGILSAVMEIISLAAVSSVKGTAALYFTVASIAIAGIMVCYISIEKKSEEFSSKLKLVTEEQSQRIQKGKSAVNLNVLKRLLRHLALLILALFFCVGNSSILHPGLTSLIESYGKGSSTWSDTYFVPVCVFLIHNLFDFIGREASNYFPKLENIYVIGIISVIRLALFPLIIFCNLQPRNNLPVVFDDDSYFIIFFILFAVLGGYLMNVVIIVVPKYCEPNERTMGTVLVAVILIVFVPVFALLSSVFVNLI